MAIDWFKDEGNYMVTLLHVVTPFGFEQSSVAEYKTVCHGLLPEADDYQHPERLGYVDAADTSDQLHIADPMKAFSIQPK